MVNITDVKASNANIKSTFPNPTAVFVGATSGIGQNTLEQLARYTDKPTILFGGRSQSAGDAILANLKTINPRGTYHFISADVSLIANVDKLCEQIKALIDHIDLMVLSAGYLDFGGLNETSEGIDFMLSLRYYARLRFVQQLLDLHPKRIVSVLAGTTEGTLIEDDLLLRKPGNYGIMSSAAHSSTMTSLVFEHLSATDAQETSFVHMYPGFVKTNVFGRISTPWIRILMEWVMLPLLTPFCISVDDAGERTLFYLTSARYPPRKGEPGVPRPEGVEVAKGNGAYLVGSTGETGEGKPMAGYRERGMGKTLWDYTVGVFNGAERKTK